MYRLNWDIAIGGYKVKTLTEVKITTSVLNLSDTATITMPGQYLNTWRKIEDKVQVGDAVTTNKAVADMEYKSISLKELLTGILAQVDPEMTVECDYDFTYEKMVVFKSIALDVLKKVHEDTKANIWFEGKTLHVHPVYQQAKGDKPVIYDTEVNVQSNELKWKDATDKKVMVEVRFTKPNGELSKQEYGVSGGEKVTKYVETNNADDLKKAAENEYNLWNYSGYEGSLTGWLVPVVKAGGSVRLRDKERPEGVYYITGVEIEFGRNGAKRKVTLGRKLG